MTGGAALYDPEHLDENVDFATRWLPLVRIASRPSMSAQRKESHAGAGNWTSLTHVISNQINFTGGKGKIRSPDKIGHHIRPSKALAVKGLSLLSWRAPILAVTASPAMLPGGTVVRTLVEGL